MRMALAFLIQSVGLGIRRALSRGQLNEHRLKDSCELKLTIVLRCNVSKSSCQLLFCWRLSFFMQQAVAS